MRLGRAVLRMTVGAFFIGHGTQKLFGWFGGNGLDATTEAFGGLGLRPARANAIAAGAAEAGGGALLVAGLATPLAASALTATMMTAIRTVHGKNGPWLTDGGYEYNVVLIAAVLALTEMGPGPLSLDAATGRERSGPGWAAIALALGAAGAFGARAINELAAKDDVPSEPAPGPPANGSGAGADVAPATG